MTVFTRSTNKEAAPVAAEQVRDLPEVAPRVPDQASVPVRSAGGTSLISAALTVLGQLQSAGDIQIDGKVEGDVRGRIVKVGSEAIIKGTIFAEGVELSGTLVGKIEAGKVVLTKTARMSGDVLHQFLQVEQGALFDGNSRPQYAKNAAKAP